MPSSKIESAPMKSGKAPKPGENDLEEMSDGPKSEPVYDFLYHDARRISSFLSQFQTYGSGTSVKAVESVIQAQSSKTGGEARGGIPGVAQGSATTLTDTSTQELDSAEWAYDPLWRNALTLMAFLKEEDLIQPSLATARIGQFVKVSGVLRIHDLATLKRLWDLPTIQRGLARKASGNRKERKRQIAAGRQASEDDTSFVMGMEILKTLPHVIAARIDDPHGLRVWSSLRNSGLTGSSSDLFLKHGATVAGHWSMVGILDAEPDSDEAPPRELTQIESGLALLTHGFSHFLDTLGPPARSFLGRPSDAYGMTPLVIYREVTG